VKLHVDHVTPVALGGTDDPSNLVTACADCNSGKAATPANAEVVADVAADAQRWAEAMKRAAEAADADKTAAAKYANAFKRRWDSHRWGDKGQYRNELPDNWKNSVDAFRRAGLPIDQLKEAVDIACTNSYIPLSRVFRYMCGVAWKRIEKIQQIAADLIEAEGKQ
jgi:hypothetical protein